MLILEMIIRITGWTQEKLANYLGVSRATINYWLNGEDISISSKKLISERFNFPLKFFDVSLEENMEIYKVIYATIYKSYIDNIQVNSNSDKDKIKRIINEIEIEDKSSYNANITEDEIIDGLAEGYNPFTGEIFDNNHILNNPEVKRVINRIIHKYQKFGINNVELSELNYSQRKKFERLREWRMQTKIDEGFYGAYMVFNDKELINIVCANITRKEDLLKVKGIGSAKYQKYGDAIYRILNFNEVGA